MIRKNTTNDAPVHFMEMARTSLPKSIDWRTKGAVSEVKLQGECGSCWAFSTIGALEGQEYRKNGHLVPLSVQNLVDCLEPNPKKKCNGQYRHEAFDYIKHNGGIDNEKSYPYKAVAGACKYNPRNAAATLKGYKYLPVGD